MAIDWCPCHFGYAFDGYDAGLIVGHGRGTRTRRSDKYAKRATKARISPG